MGPVMLDPRKCKLGERYKLWITGFVGEWIAKVIAIDRDGWPILEPETWPLLKKGDYVLIELVKILQK
jgi:hypothetical protein